MNRTQSRWSEYDIHVATSDLPIHEKAWLLKRSERAIEVKILKLKKIKQ